MVASFSRRYLIAARYAFLEQVQNRFALILLIVFVPTWYYIAYVFTTNDTVVFRFRVTDIYLQVSSLHLTFLTLGLNAITLIVGFMFFASTRKSTQFDHRLVLSGFPQLLLILAKLTSLVVISFVVSVYASAVLYAYWHPIALPLVWLSFFCAALSYGGLGLLLGVLVRGELEGFFLVIMISLIDTFIQNPIGNPAADKDFIRWFPSFAPTQVYVAGGFTHVVPWIFVLVSLAWLVTFATLGLIIFWWKTRAWGVHIIPSFESAMKPVQISSSEHP